VTDSDRQEAEGRVAQLMQSVGYAIWQVQGLEDTLAAYIVVRLRESQGVGLDRGAELTAELARLELGKLIAQLRGAGVLPAEALQRLAKLRDERNWLVHRAWRENHGVIADSARLAHLLQRLAALAEDALALNKHMAAEVEACVSSAGVTREYIDREADRLRRSWESSD